MILLDPLLVAVSGGVVGLVLARALLHKLADPERHLGFVADYRILPQALVAPGAYGLIAAEGLALAGLLGSLLWAPARPFGAGLSAALFVLYAAAMGLVLAGGRRSVECGCGGAGQPVSPRLILRNALLTLLALMAAVSPLPRPIGWAEGLILPAAILTVWLMILILEQIDRIRHHIQETE